MSVGLATRVLAVAVAGGVVGAGLTAAGVDSPVRAILVLMFLAVAPTAAIARLLGRFDPFARLIIAGTATIAILSLIALIMLAWGVWSPLGGLLAVAAVTSACVVARMPSVRRWLTARARASRSRVTARVRAASSPTTARVRVGRTGTNPWLDLTEAKPSARSRSQSSVPAGSAAEAAQDASTAESDRPHS